MGKKKTKGNKNKNNRNRNRGAQTSENRQIRSICNQEIRTERYISSDTVAVSGASPVEAYALALKLVTDELLDNVLSRGVVKDERRLDERNYLRMYFTEMVRAMSSYPRLLFPIVEGVLIGLANGPPWIDRRVKALGSPEPLPILHWVCQWKLLRVNCRNCYISEDELVDMVLKAGASVNEIAANATNAMFFAVKYANTMAIDALLQAGINLQQRDEFGRTCMYNALEHPRPQLIEKLLAEGLDVHETYLSHALGDNGRIAHSFEMSSSDRVLLLLNNIQGEYKNQLISWNLLGAPTSTDIGETLLLLRQRGAKLTENASPVLSLINALFKDKYFSSRESIRHEELCKDVASYLVGNIVPERFLPSASDEIQKEETEDCSSDEECPICLSPAIKKPVTLCCGHSFCRKCLLNDGSTIMRCPLCRGEIGLDITLPDFSCLPDIRTGHRVQMEKIMGTDTKSLQFRGPTFLDENQLILEAKFQGLYNAGDSFRDVQRKLVQSVFSRPATELCLQMTTKNEERLVKPAMDLAASVRMANDSHVYLGCGHGISCIEILVNGFPVLARISNRSLYTVISSSVVESLGLKKIKRLQTRKFVGADGNKMSGGAMTCLEPIVLTIGNIDVNVRNAIERGKNNGSTDKLAMMFGVQLGEDFLTSSRWCPIDFDLGEESQNSFMRSKDFYDNSLQFVTGPSKNMLRFYSNDGKTAYAPLLPFGPFDSETNLTLSFKENVKFDQCMWCSRVFPEGMLTCSICYKAGKLATYCDERCQVAGFKCHKRFHSDLPRDTSPSV